MKNQLSTAITAFLLLAFLARAHGTPIIAIEHPAEIALSPRGNVWAWGQIALVSQLYRPGSLTDQLT